MNNKPIVITIITLLSICVIILTGILILGITNHNIFQFNFDFNNIKIVDEYEIDQEEVKSINLNLNSADVEIIDTSTNKIKVEYYSNKENNVKIKYNASNIIIDEEKEDVCIGFCFNSKKVKLYIPNSYTGEYDFALKSGDIKADIKLQNVKKITTISGDISLKEVDHTNIQSMSGDIEIKQVTEQANIKTASGDIDIANIAINKKSSIETTSGDISIANLEIEDNSLIKTISGDILIRNHRNNCYIETKTTSGDVNIKNSDRKSDLVLTLETISGDIDVLK